MKLRLRLLSVLCVLLLTTLLTMAKEYHVSVSGSNKNCGSQAEPFKTISAAAIIAKPGDVITVHAGTYRERINPTRGGTSDSKRIVYQAAKGEKVVIKGSESIKGWEEVKRDTWKVTIPNEFFGNFNPYADLIAGDWFGPLGRQYHTGAVYLNEHWLVEAINLDDVLKPIGEAASSYSLPSNQFLMNLANLKPCEGLVSDKSISAADFTAENGVKKAPCSQGGECIGWIVQGSWVRYDGVDFGSATQQIEFLAASETQGGVIEIRMDKPDGDLLGSCSIPNTGGWQSWASFRAKIKPVSGVKNICLVFREPMSEEAMKLRLWFADVNSTTTTIWAQFKDINPNDAEVEINARQSVFYPDKPGVNYITVRGFTMKDAATPWAPPTTEQIGLIGTHWSKGWIIEDNNISYSTCVGVTLGKYGDKWDNTSQNSAEGYVKTIERALENGWSKENIGHHVVRNNHISHCEQGGVVGSLGAVFSEIIGNEIHDIHVRRLFSGAEMGGIKIHASIDMLIQGNYIHHCEKGIWLDWMAQGTRVTSNLCHDNITMDLFMEVDHGPYVVDNNIFLSREFLWDWSEGGCFAHNLIGGKIYISPQGRQTPYHKPHSTEVVALHDIPGSDNRFYNNIFLASTGLGVYQNSKSPVFADGNIYLNHTTPFPGEKNNFKMLEFNSNVKVVEEDNGFYLHISLPEIQTNCNRKLVTTDLLGKTIVSNASFENYDGRPLEINLDYFGKKRDLQDPSPGPFENNKYGALIYKVR